MKIGKILKERIELLGISLNELSSLTFIDIEILKNLHNNKLDYDNLEEYDKSLLCDALYCSEEYFFDECERERDLIGASMNRGSKQDKVAIETKCKIYKFIKDYTFIDEIINGGV